MNPLRYLSSSANVYVSRNFLVWLGITALALLVIVGFFETIELLRRVMSHPNASLSIIFELTLLVLPQRFIELLPFIVFLASLLSLWRLNQLHEITALRAMGVSGGQLALGLCITAIMIGASSLLVLNPIAASFNSRHNALEERILKHNQQHLTIS
ncbi:MAG: LptF/LptG family permease, partial [Alphaproteobacteria bacterium]|nr:LptF/LptG family permease [Alphaproteobacteria bacterium]